MKLSILRCTQIVAVLAFPVADYANTHILLEHTLSHLSPKSKWCFHKCILITFASVGFLQIQIKLSDTQQILSECVHPAPVSVSTSLIIVSS